MGANNKAPAERVVHWRLRTGSCRCGVDKRIGIQYSSSFKLAVVTCRSCLTLAERDGVQQ